MRALSLLGASVAIFAVAFGSSEATAQCKKTERNFCVVCVLKFDHSEGTGRIPGGGKFPGTTGPAICNNMRPGPAILRINGSFLNEPGSGSSYVGTSKNVVSWSIDNLEPEQQVVDAINPNSFPGGYRKIDMTRDFPINIADSRRRILKLKMESVACLGQDNVVPDSCNFDGTISIISRQTLSGK